MGSIELNYQIKLSENLCQRVCVTNKNVNVQKKRCECLAFSQIFTSYQVIAN